VGELSKLDVPLVVDIGSGLLAPEPLLPDEPDATTVLRQGATLVTASGDKLLGGPQAGLLLGGSDTGAELVGRLRRHPLARALRVDKLTLAALEATLTGPPTPTAKGLHADPAELARRAEALARRLRAAGIEAEAVPSAATVGGGGAPGVTLPSAAVAVSDHYAAALRTGRPSVLGRVEGGRCLLDLRALPEESDDPLCDAVLAVTAEGPQA
jgi:L-seryl-tRNA(Ser) seleniumtransferase